MPNAIRRRGNPLCLGRLLIYMNYALKLKNPKWQRKRLEIMSRDKFMCQLCNDTETTLNVHHKKYTREIWNEPAVNLITLCENCHLAIELSKQIEKELPLYSIKRINKPHFSIVILQYKTFILGIDLQKKCIDVFWHNDIIHEIHNRIITLKNGR